jgi:hypothetical protein
LLNAASVFTLKREFVHPPPKKVSLAQGISTGPATTALDTRENASPSAARDAGFMEVSKGVSNGQAHD